MDTCNKGNGIGWCNSDGVMVKVKVVMASTDNNVMVVMDCHSGNGRDNKGCSVMIVVVMTILVVVRTSKDNV